jgi:hypothetical protein
LVTNALLHMVTNSLDKLLHNKTWTEITEVITKDTTIKTNKWWIKTNTHHIQICRIMDNILKEWWQCQICSRSIQILFSNLTHWTKWVPAFKDRIQTTLLQCSNNQGLTRTVTSKINLQELVEIKTFKT